ncbi:hypothetical protein [Bradyrhizobium icense]|nr:hypothetical protein [Bradyrhizobium icense]
MRPTERRDSGQADLLRSRLDAFIDMNHALVKLTRTIDPRSLGILLIDRGLSLALRRRWARCEIRLPSFKPSLKLTRIRLCADPRSSQPKSQLLVA